MFNAKIITWNETGDYYVHVNTLIVVYKIVFGFIIYNS